MISAVVHRKLRSLTLFAGIAMASVAVPTGVSSQAVGLPGQDRKLPVEITAEDGIEWRQESKEYVARGNAKATQGEATVHAQVLTAYYRELPDGGTTIWRIDADGDVRIVSPTQTAYGDKAVYDIDKGVLVLTGDKLRLITETDKLTARDSLEYWEKRSLAVARGNAIAVRGENRLRADILTAHFQKNSDGKSALSRIDAFDNVLVSSPEEIATGSQGVYNVKTGIAILTGSVKITRGTNQLRGEYAEVDLNSGVSRLFGGARQGVQGYFTPETAKSPSRNSNRKPQ